MIGLIKASQEADDKGGGTVVYNSSLSLTYTHPWDLCNSEGKSLLTDT